MEAPRKPAPGEKKKPYTKPELQVYGNLADITQMIGITGNSDGGGIPATSKTSL